MFGKKKNSQEQMRDSKRTITQATREMERERAQLQRREKELIAQIKQAANNRDQATAKVLAKELTKVRKMNERNLGMQSQMRSVGMQAQTMASQQKMVQSVATASKAIGVMNNSMNTQQMAKTLSDFQRQTAELDMKQDMMDDTLESVFDDEDDINEADSIVGQVLDEIGIELKGQLLDAPSSSLSSQSVGVSQQQRQQNRLHE